MARGSIVVDFQGRLRARIITQIAGMIIPGPGRLKFTLLDDAERELAAWEVAVNKLGGPAIIPQPYPTPGASMQTSSGT
jgi:hypothetical protein